MFPIHAPALRERPGDIPLLAGYFCERCRLSLGLERLRIQPQALQLLERHDWPGNVRELEHAIHRAAVLARAEQGSQAPTLANHHFNLAAGPCPLHQPRHRADDPLARRPWPARRHRRLPARADRADPGRP